MASSAGQAQQHSKLIHSYGIHADHTQALQQERSGKGQPPVEGLLAAGGLRVRLPYRANRRAYV